MKGAYSRAEKRQQNHWKMEKYAYYKNHSVPTSSEVLLQKW